MVPFTCAVYASPVDGIPKWAARVAASCSSADTSRLSARTSSLKAHTTLSCALWKKLVSHQNLDGSCYVSFAEAHAKALDLFLRVGSTPCRADRH
jgi:hypothetical protein